MGKKQSKRELLAALIKDVERWPGEARPGRLQRRRMRRLEDLLGCCPLRVMEREWLSLAEIWSLRAECGPEPWTRAFWLSTLRAWQDWLAVAEPRDSWPAPEGPPVSYLNEPSPTYRDFLIPRPLC